MKLPVEEAEAEADPVEDPDIPVEDPVTEPEALTPDEIADPVSVALIEPDIVGAVLVAVALALVNEDDAVATAKSPDSAKTSLMLEMFTS